MIGELMKFFPHDDVASHLPARLHLLERLVGGQEAEDAVRNDVAHSEQQLAQVVLVRKRLRGLVVAQEIAASRSARDRPYPHLRVHI